MSLQKSKETFTITDLAREFDLTTRAIRFYEDKGLISPAREGQRRIYSARDRVRLQLVLRGKRLGFSLAETQEILDLYDRAPDETAQLKHLLGKICERREILLRQREDIDISLKEMDVLEGQCRDILKTRGEL